MNDRDLIIGALLGAGVACVAAGMYPLTGLPVRWLSTVGGVAGGAAILCALAYDLGCTHGEANA